MHTTISIIRTDSSFRATSRAIAALLLGIPTTSPLTRGSVEVRDQEILSESLR
jgi:hypothetical protein